MLKWGDASADIIKVYHQSIERQQNPMQNLTAHKGVARREISELRSMIAASEHANLKHRENLFLPTIDKEVPPKPFTSWFDNARALEAKVCSYVESLGDRLQWWQEKPTPDNQATPWKVDWQKVLVDVSSVSMRTASQAALDFEKALGSNFAVGSFHKRDVLVGVVVGSPPSLQGYYALDFAKFLIDDDDAKKAVAQISAAIYSPDVREVAGIRTLIEKGDLALASSALKQLYHGLLTSDALNTSPLWKNQALGKATLHRLMVEFFVGSGGSLNENNIITGQGNTEWDRISTNLRSRNLSIAIDGTVLFPNHTGTVTQAQFDSQNTIGKILLSLQDVLDGKPTAYFDHELAHADLTADPNYTSISIVLAGPVQFGTREGSYDNRYNFQELLIRIRMLKSALEKGTEEGDSEAKVLCQECEKHIKLSHKNVDILKDLLPKALATVRSDNVGEVQINNEGIPFREFVPSGWTIAVNQKISFANHQDVGLSNSNAQFVLLPAFANSLELYGSSKYISNKLGALVRKYIPLVTGITPYVLKFERVHSAIEKHLQDGVGDRKKLLSRLSALERPTDTYLLNLSASRNRRRK